ncbi:MAG: Hsp20/alpha crystallin family protein [Phycisphaerae bacterium]
MNLIPWRDKRSNSAIRSRSVDSSISRFRRDMERMFERFFEDPFGMVRAPLAFPEGWAPSLDVVESDKEVTVKAELPGVDPEDLDITISGSVLTISGEKSESTETKGDSWYQSERRFGTFRRRVQLPSYVDGDKVSAEHANGVLTIHLEKLNSAAPKRVPVKAAAR